MATTENNVRESFVDAKGNVYILYPKTRAENVDGLASLLENKADKAPLLTLNATTQYSTMDGYTESGMFWINPGAVQDVPGGQWGFLRVFSNGNILQEFTGYSDSARAVRMFVNNAWTAWDLSQSGTWAPTVSGVTNYTKRNGTWTRIRNMVILSWHCYGTFAGSTSDQITITGVPESLTPAYATAGGGGASGYYAPANTIFTGWRISTNRKIYAMGQEYGTTGTRWESENIKQNTGVAFSVSGCIAYQVN